MDDNHPGRTLTNIQKDYSTQKGIPLKLHENKVFSVLFNGYYHYLEYNKTPTGAIVIPRFPNGDFLVLKQRRAPVFGESIEFPRGGVDIDEDPEVGASRELREETGYDLKTASFTFLGILGADTATLNGFSHVFVADIPEGSVPGAFDTDEIISLSRVSAGELRRLVRDNVIVDGHSLAAYGMLLART